MTLQYMMAMLSELSKIPLSEYNEEGTFLRRYTHSSDVKKLPEALDLLVKQFINACNSKQLHITYLERLPVIVCGFKAEDTGNYNIWGPIQWKKLNAAQKVRFVDTCCYDDGTSAVSVVSMRQFVSEIAIVYSLLLDREVTHHEVVSWMELHGQETYSSEAVYSSVTEEEKFAYRIRIEDEAMLNHSYLDEQVVWSAVRRGDVEAVKSYMNQPSPRYPLVIKDDPLKNEAYMAVVAIGIISRIAIESGVTSSESFFLSDLYIKRISECNRHSEISQVMTEGHLAFTELVKRKHMRSISNRHVEGCKNIIATDIFKKITTTDIAGKLNLRATYLNRVFKEYEGMTVTEYIHQEKVNAAANMLVYSDKSIAEIGDYLQFCSQSYFSKIFKKYKGLTPKSYRLANQSKGF